MASVCVIGAGASGCSAAIFAARNGAEVILLEASASPAEKILKTGNGRCNFTNLEMSSSDYNNIFAEHIISRFTPYDAIDFFEGMGVKPIRSGSYVYPRTNEAKTIRDALLAELSRYGVKVHNNTNVYYINKHSDGFEIVAEGYTYKADTVILACGGLGDSNGNAYKYAFKLGHKSSKTVPALTALVSKNNLNNAKGVRCYARLVLMIDDKPICEESGELQITDFGVSGIPVFQLSGKAALALSEGKSVKLSIDFAPEISADEIVNYSERFGMSGIIPAKLVGVFSRSNIEPAGIKNYLLDISDVRDFSFAQVTSGGIITDDINPATLESKLVKGLYFCGEMLDVDGRCGGYNLHFAWGSGAVAGSAAAGTSYEGISKSRAEAIKESLSECIKS